MRLLSLRLRNVGVFADTEVVLADDARGETREPRLVNVLFGADGIGKTTLLTALSVTRPGYSLPPVPHPRAFGPGLGASARPPEVPSYAVTEWLLGADDPERPHPLVVASPTAVIDAEAADEALTRRREQSLFDRRAQSEGGFVFVALSGARWFSRTPNMLSMPERAVMRYDVRHAQTFDDPTRSDLTRETKQVLAYASIAQALGGERAEYAHLGRFDAAVRAVTDIMLEPFGYTYAGVSPLSLEPEARHPSGRIIGFDALPRAARHLVAFGALPLRALFAAYPHAEDPRDSEGVVAIDDVETQQDPATLRGLVSLLRRALPGVQWILGTSSTQLANACAPGEVVSLRQGVETRVEVGEGALH